MYMNNFKKISIIITVVIIITGMPGDSNWPEWSILWGIFLTAVACIHLRNARPWRKTSSQPVPPKQVHRKAVIHRNSGLGGRNVLSFSAFCKVHWRKTDYHKKEIQKRGSGIINWTIKERSLSSVYYNSWRWIKLSSNFKDS